MDISLSPDLDAIVLRSISSGQYHSAGDVVREALQLLEERDSSRQAELAAFQAELEKRLAHLDRNGGISAEDARAQVEQHAREWRRTHA